MRNKTDKIPQVLFYAMLIAVVGGVYFRFVGLDKAPFWTDEYYLAQSIRNLLQHWLPAYECGGYYTRGLLMQYLGAPFFLWGSSDEFSLRSISVIFNLLAIIPLFQLSRRIGGEVVAYAVVILFSLSAWEVEMARFARMYAPFQALFIWHVYLLHRVLFEHDRRALYWMYAVSLISVFVYEGAIFLLLLNFVPLAFEERYRKLPPVVLPTILFLGGYAFLQADTRRLGVEEFMPPDYSASTLGDPAGPIEAPDLLITTFPDGTAWLIGFGLVGALCVVLAVFATRRELRTAVDLPAVLRAAALTMCVFFALLNLYALAAVTGLLLYLSGPFGIGLPDKMSVRACLIAVGVTFVFWLVFAVSTELWQQLPDTDRTSKVYRFALVLFNYPPIGFKIVGRWLDAMPVLTIALGLLIGLALYVLKAQRDTRSMEFRMLVILVVSLAFAMAALSQLYVQVRYTFFLYPLILLLALAAVSRLVIWMNYRGRAEHTVVVICALGLFMVGEDFNVTHLLNIDSQAALYRQGYDRSRANQYYNRYDSRSPAEYVNEHREADDVIVTSVVAVPYYLDRIDYFYLNRASHKFLGVVGCHGQRELWSNAAMMSRPGELQSLLAEGKRTVWLVTQSRRQMREMPELSKLVDQYRERVEYVSPDGTIEVVRVPRMSTAKKMLSGQ